MEISFEQLDLNEILRYMGYKNQKKSDELSTLIEDTVKESLKIVRPRTIYQIFPIEWSNESILVSGSSLSFPGKAIQSHLKGSHQVALLAATLGPQMDQLLQITGKFDLTKSLILEATATEMIEKICDEMQASISREATQKNLFITDRFSPGYGDLPIEIQPTFLNVLDATRKIGLTCTSNSTMIPSKSVTAIIGFYQGEKKETTAACSYCQLYEHCQYRKDGNYCGHPKTS